jgi:hypothetical protein
MEAWPFLFSKSAGKERTVVVLPEILKGEDAARLIPHLTGVTMADERSRAGGALLLREVPHSTLGSLHVVFRNRPATEADLGRAPNDLFPEYVSEGFIARGGEPHLAYSRAHLEAASKAVAGKLRQCEESRTWGEREALSDLKLELASNAGANMRLIGIHGSNAVARAHYEDLRRIWQAEGREETQRAAAARAGEGTVSWTQRLRRALPETGPKRALLFAAVGGVTLCGVLAAQYWRDRRDAERTR